MKSWQNYASSTNGTSNVKDICASEMPASTPTMKEQMENQRLGLGMVTGTRPKNPKNS